MKLVMDDKAIVAIVALLMDYQDRDNVNLPLYEKQLREAEKGIENLVNAIQQGIFTKSTRERLEKLESLKEELEQKIALEKLEKPRISEAFMRFWLLKFRKLDTRQQSHRKMLIDTFVNAVFLYDDKLVLTFNFKDGTRTMNLDDLEAASRDGKKDAGGSDMDEATPHFTKPASHTSNREDGAGFLRAGEKVLPFFDCRDLLSIHQRFTMIPGGGGMRHQRF